VIDAPTLPASPRGADVEARLQALEDTEAVKKAMFRYYRCLDFKLFDELSDCFTENVTADYGMPGWGARGRDELVGFLVANESREDYRVSHSSHNEEIESGFGLYDMEFEKSDRWRIRTLKLHYVYREEYHVYIDNVPTPSLTPALGSGE
jgi:hypothetical protein